MRMVRGLDNLTNYLKENNMQMGKSTIYSLIKQGKLPHSKPSPRVLLFDLDKIDKYMRGELND